MLNQTNLSQAISSSYKDIQNMKRSPPQRYATNPDKVRDMITRTLLRTRQRIERFRAVDASLKMLEGSRVVKPWREAAKNAIKKLQSYEKDAMAAQKRWARVVPNPDRSLSIYPIANEWMGNLTTPFFRALDSLSSAIQTKYGKNVIPYRKMTPSDTKPEFTKNARYSKHKTILANATPSAAFGVVEKAWNEYLKARRQSTPKMISPRDVGNELAVIRHNRAIFKGYQNKSMYVSKSLVPAIRKILKMYDTYIRHLKKTYDDSLKQKPTIPNNILATNFSDAVNSFFRYIHKQVKIDNVTYIRTNHGGNTSNQIKNREITSLRKLINAQRYELAYTSQQREKLSKKLESATQKIKRMVLGSKMNKKTIQNVSKELNALKQLEKEMIEVATKKNQSFKNITYSLDFTLPGYMMNGKNEKNEMINNLKREIENLKHQEDEKAVRALQYFYKIGEQKKQIDDLKSQLNRLRQFSTL